MLPDDKEKPGPSSPAVERATTGASPLHASFDRVRQSLVSLAAGDSGGESSSARKAQLAIVARGHGFAALSPETDDEVAGGSPASLERVPGCVATVRVQATLLGSGGENSWIRLVGDADALLSRGLLALLSEALAGPGVTARDVLRLEPSSVAERLGLRAILSPGRNDGLASMTEVVQGQVRRLLKRAEDADGSASAKMAAGEQQEGNIETRARRPSVAVLLSGGVDSSVALHLLLREGYDVTAFYLKIWLEDEMAHLGECPWEEDYRMCREVCDQAGVPLESVSLQEQYKERIIAYTLDEAKKGRTPNPDVLCNSRVKFGCFYDAIAGRDFDFVASGHYARLEERADGGANGPAPMRLLRAPDPVKDQTYFLCALTQEQLRRAKFPIGRFLKSEVRELAQRFQLPNRDRPDSQGLCFLGKVKFDEFMRAYLGDDPGDIVDAAEGRVIGRHSGLWYHTIGQRRGIGRVLNPVESSRGPWYIAAKDPERNLILASNDYASEKFDGARSEFYVEDITWIAGESPLSDEETDGRFTMKVRHGPTLVNGTLSLSRGDGAGAAGRVRLDAKDKGLAPGQYCVFYTLGAEECLGAGVISERHWAALLLMDSDIAATVQVAQ